MLAWSMSRLKDSDCLAKFKMIHITKEVKSKIHPKGMEGIELHEALEHYAKTGAPLPITLQPLKPALDKLLNNLSDKKIERAFAFTEDWQFVDWFDANVWCRIKADLLGFKDDACIYVDYKSGKVDNDPTQAFMTAVAIFQAYPQVNVVTCYNWFIRQNLFIPPLACYPSEVKEHPYCLYIREDEYPVELCGGLYHRKHLPVYLEIFHALPKHIYEAEQNNDFPYQPSRNSCRFCPAKGTCSVAAT